MCTMISDYSLKKNKESRRFFRGLPFICTKKKISFLFLSPPLSPCLSPCLPPVSPLSPPCLPPISPLSPPCLPPVSPLSPPCLSPVSPPSFPLSLSLSPSLFPPPPPSLSLLFFQCTVEEYTRFYGTCFTSPVCRICFTVRPFSLCIVNLGYEPKLN